MLIIFQLHHDIIHCLHDLFETQVSLFCSKIESGNKMGQVKCLPFVVIIQLINDYKRATGYWYFKERLSVELLVVALVMTYLHIHGLDVFMSAISSCFVIGLKIEEKHISALDTRDDCTKGDPSDSYFFKLSKIDYWCTPD